MRRLVFAFRFSVAIASRCAFAQEENGEVRVSIVLNADGSRTVYETNAANHKTMATTTGKDGKLREKIRWDLDENGRFLRGEVFGPKEQFRFILQNKYDSNKHMLEEAHRAKAHRMMGKIFYLND